ncbi:MAG: thiol oxidoreductase, partial [Bacteroidaceae bacterium]|nr:thiol oxidoreductase [Bacteroidaceae bacterium]
MKTTSLLHVALALAAATSVLSCQEDGLTVEEIDVPAGYSLSAGTSTVFTTSSYAFDSEADWVTGALKRRFVRGDKLY